MQFVDHARTEYVSLGQAEEAIAHGQIDGEAQIAVGDLLSGCARNVAGSEGQIRTEVGEKEAAGNFVASVFKFAIIVRGELVVIEPARLAEMESRAGSWVRGIGGSSRAHSAARCRRAR